MITMIHNCHVRSMLESHCITGQYSARSVQWFVFVWKCGRCIAGMGFKADIVGTCLHGQYYGINRWLAAQVDKVPTKYVGVLHGDNLSGGPGGIVQPT